MGNAASVLDESVSAQSWYVQVVGAENLRDADATFGVGKSDPFVVCRVGAKGSTWAEKGLSGSLTWTSKTVDDCLSPTWDLGFVANVDGDWEVDARVYDRDVVGEDFLGRAVASPSQGESAVTAPVAGGTRPRGTVSFKFWSSAADDVSGTDSSPKWAESILMAELHAHEGNDDTAPVVNGSVAGGDDGPFSALSLASDWTAASGEGLFDALGKLFGRKHATTPHNFGYIADIVALGGPSYTNLFYGRSKDGGETVASFPGPGATTLLTHAAVVAGLEAHVARVDAGEVTRSGPDGFLGMLRLNGAWWRRSKTHVVEPPCISLAAPVEVHKWIRPIYDYAMAIDAGDAASFKADARLTIDSHSNAAKPLAVRLDVKLWFTRVLHSRVVGLELSEAECAEFVSMQVKVSLLASFMPDGATDVVGPLLGLEDAVIWREKMLDRYIPALDAKLKNCAAYETAFPGEASSHDRGKQLLLASAFLDAMLFAGGTSCATLLSCALAAVYAEGSPLDRAAVPQAKDEAFAAAVVWETIRFFPAVVGFPFFKGPGTNKQGTERVILGLGPAMKDPRAWGPDAEAFKLRPLSEYHKSVAFAEHATSATNASGNRNCPGKDLGIVLIQSFLASWFETDEKWALPAEEQAKIDFKGSPLTKPDGFAFHPK
ncbi:hypothetical protein M885DRAFT_506839 [Pelagophyceae sp. CCMP2097]|nr:hypothetical protein M885DRAFT_506839 [Pelagophyceae sp. CCMP2097]